MRLTAAPVQTSADSGIGAMRPTTVSLTRMYVL